MEVLLFSRRYINIYIASLKSEEKPMMWLCIPVLKLKDWQQFPRVASDEGFFHPILWKHRVPAAEISPEVLLSHTFLLDGCHLTFPWKGRMEMKRDLSAICPDPLNSGVPLAYIFHRAWLLWPYSALAIQLGTLYSKERGKNVYFFISKFALPASPWESLQTLRCIISHLLTCTDHKYWARILPVTFLQAVTLWHFLCWITVKCFITGSTDNTILGTICGPVKRGFWKVICMSDSSYLVKHREHKQLPSSMEGNLAFWVILVKWKT